MIEEKEIYLILKLNRPVKKVWKNVKVILITQNSGAVVRKGGSEITPLSITSTPNNIIEKLPTKHFSKLAIEEKYCYGQNRKQCQK